MGGGPHIRIWVLAPGGGKWPDIISSLTNPELYFQPGGRGGEDMALNLEISSVSVLISTELMLGLYSISTTSFPFSIVSFHVIWE